MKFDVVFSNPPYNRGMDIKILKEILDFSEEVVVVHPSTWLFDMKGKSKLFVDFKKKINKKVESIETFNGSSVFGVVINSPVTITHINNTYEGSIEVNSFGTNFEADSIYEITKYGNNWLKFIKSYYQSMSEYCSKHGSVWDYNKTSIDKTKFHCQLAANIGNINKNISAKELYKDDFYTMIVKDENVNKGIRIPDITKPGNPIPTFEFATEFERDNFIKYLKTDFARFNLSMLKNNPCVSLGEMELIPWLDFNEEWDDDKLFAKFNVSQEMQDYIRDFIPDYHGIRK